MFVKICGITNTDDALFAAEAGADALGFIFVPETPRYTEPQKACEIIGKLPEDIRKFGVFLDEAVSEVVRVTNKLGLDYVQLHGSESPGYCARLNGEVSASIVKAFRIGQRGDLDPIADYDIIGFLLLDSFVEGKAGGTGKVFDWSLAVEAKRYGKPIILSGGLTPENVSEAVAKVSPYGVDVSSGVEKAPGVKDGDKVRDFIRRARGAAEEL